METAKCLQRLVMPNARFGASESMYIRGSFFHFREISLPYFPEGKFLLIPITMVFPLFSGKKNAEYTISRSMHQALG